MTSAGPSRAWNYRRRVIGAAICLAPVVLFVASLIASQVAPRDSGMGIGLVVCAVPVIDMLRYHRFTVGRYWTGEYGNAEPRSRAASSMRTIAASYASSIAAASDPGSSGTLSTRYTRWRQ